MKKIFKIKFGLKTSRLLVLTLGLFLIISSCEEDTAFNLGPTLASYSDGIQNLDEEGVDCGGNTGVPCPSCDDGIQNQGEEGIDCGGPCTMCIPTPRADALVSGPLPYYYTFEANDASSGKNLVPVAQANQGVTFNLGTADPAGSDDLVGQILRPQNGPFGGFEDFKFQPQPTPIDFSMYDKFALDVYIPSSNDFSGNLQPVVEVILHDNVDGNFFQRWTVIPVTVDAANFDSWVTLKFDGTNAVAADTGAFLRDNTTYDNITLRFGGSGHTEAGEFFIKDFKPTTSFVAPGTPRADALAGTGLPIYYTFETGDAASGLNLIPVATANQGVVPSYGVADPAGSDNGVTRIDRPANGPFGGFEDFKFQPQAENIDFSVYHKFKLDVYIPSSNDFSGNLAPLVELILHDNNDGFFERWTVIGVSIDASDFDSWVTVEFDGTNATSAADGTLLPANTTYDNYTLRLGGFGHVEAGEFYIKDFVPFE